MAIQHVPGRKAGSIMLYALSTCVWCKKTKAVLDSLGVEYSYAYVDLLPDKEKEEVLDIIRKWNPACNFPTMVINNRKCIVGFREDEIREALR
ncbi:MAG: Glutaredoxin [Dehalococcoidales bacterium]|nr:Glutaredoxin [Dehalococcoidales bacterium]